MSNGWHGASDESAGKLVLYAALAGNLGIAATKLVAGGITGSSSMLTEGIHSLVDSGNEVLLLYGRHRAKRPPDEVHPLGYGRELYFWSFVVALLIFTGGAGVSIYEGIVHIRHPEMLGRPVMIFVVLGVAFLFESGSLFFAVREFLRNKDDEQNWWRALRSSKDPAVFVVLVEDSAALTGIVVAAGFIGLTLMTGNPRWDGVGSIVIGTILASVAILLAAECKALLIGERAAPKLQRSLAALAEEVPGIERVNEVLTIHLAPDQIIATLSIDFDETLSIGQVEEMADRLEKSIKSAHPAITRIFIRPQSPKNAEDEKRGLQSPDA